MTTGQSEQHDVVIVGAGFAGLYALYRLRNLGLKAIVLEAGQGIGGTWYWNRYPGARCDVESFEYSFSFDEALQQRWRWSERYATQPEILRYLEHVADSHDLNKDIRLSTRLEGAAWDDTNQCWGLETSSGELNCRFLVMATGCLSTPNIPAIPGMDSFSGPLFHTGQWPQEGIDLSGKRVGVIGTGSSGVQVISNIAPVVGELHVLQRTPHYVVPAGIRPISAEEDAQVKQRYPEFREELASSLLGMGVSSQGGSAKEADPEARQQRYEAAWQKGGPGFLMCYDDLLVDSESNRTACDFIAGRIRSMVKDPDTAEALVPDLARFPVGARRLVLDDNYYSRYNQDNVHLVDTLQDPLERITPTGVRLASGREIPLDVIILGTGFDALTGALLKIDIRGRQGLALRESWQQGPETYLGVAMAGFPNLFTITGPGSPSVFSNVVVSIEQHVNFISAMIDWMRAHGYRSAEASTEAVRDWSRHVMEVAEPTVLVKVNSSWYWGANVAGKPRSFLPYLGGVGAYRETCSQVSGADYWGFAFSA